MRNKFLSVLVFLNTLLCITVQGETYFVAPDGSDSNTGSISDPLLTIAKAITMSSAGDTVFLRGGTYEYTSTISITVSGDPSSRIYLWAYPGEKPLLDFSGQAFGSAGIKLTGSYWHIKGISIKGAGDNGLYIISDAHDNIIEFCEFYENRDSGLQLSKGAHDNQIINCDSYWNADPTDYGDADGFAVKLDVGTGNYFYGCRSWLNVDDGWDGYMRGADDVTTTIENCWTWKNGYFKDGTDAGASANGNGFKCGGSDDKTLMHNFILRNCLAFENKAKGFDQNNNKGSMTFYNCTGHNNLGNNYSIPLALNTGKTCTIINCVVLGKYSLGSFVVQETNSWQSPFVTSADDFVSISPDEVTAPRQADGSLPVIAYMHLAPGSDLIDAGTDVGIPYHGSKPDLGAWETESYNLIVEVQGSGNVLLDPVGGVYTPGTIVTLTAVPLEGNNFIEWQGDVTGTQTVVQVEMTSDMNVTANFEVAEGILDNRNPDTAVLSCYPTIAGDYTTLKLNCTNQEMMNVSVYSMTGLKVKDFGMKPFIAGENSVKVPLCELKPGTYLVRLASKGRYLHCKLIKS
jgi:hypothetical protein